MTPKRLRTECMELCVLATATLRDVMVMIDRGKLGLAVVVDADRRVLGTVTDGDLRRAILAGVTLETPASAVMNAKFTAVDDSVSAVALLDLMQTRSIRQVPVVDAAGVLVGVHFLPDFVESSLRPNWAVVMAGGEGQRLRPLTADTPKPMLPIGNKPLLENTVSLLVTHGFRRLFMAVNYLGDRIESHFGDGARFGCAISYLRESGPLGTAGALSMLPKGAAAPFLVLNGDLLTDVDLSVLLDFHNESGASATQCVREYHYEVPFGVVDCVDGEVRGLVEKPQHRLLINAGIYVLGPGYLDFLQPGEPCSMPELLERGRRAGDRVAAFPIRERWTDIGHLDDYHRAHSTWERQDKDAV